MEKENNSNYDILASAISELDFYALNMEVLGVYFKLKIREVILLEANYKAMREALQEIPNEKTRLAFLKTYTEKLDNSIIHYHFLVDGKTLKVHIKKDEILEDVFHQLKAYRLKTKTALCAVKDYMKRKKIKRDPKIKEIIEALNDRDFRAAFYSEPYKEELEKLKEIKIEAGEGIANAPEYYLAMLENYDSIEPDLKFYKNFYDHVFNEKNKKPLKRRSTQTAEKPA